MRDETGILFLNYNQPLSVMNLYSARVKTKEYMDKDVTIRGWYSRSPVPQLEIYEMEKDGNTKRVSSRKTWKIVRIIALIFGIAYTALYLGAWNLL